jgi:hypothetical protein
LNLIEVILAQGSKLTGGALFFSPGAFTPKQADLPLR